MILLIELKLVLFSITRSVTNFMNMKSTFILMGKIKFENLKSVIYVALCSFFAAINKKECVLLRLAS